MRRGRPMSGERSRQNSPGQESACVGAASAIAACSSRKRFQTPSPPHARVEMHVITAPTLRLDRGPDRTRLLETTRLLRPRLLLLDPLVRLHGIDENNAGEVAQLLAYFRSLQRQLELSVVLVHHTRK